MYPQNSQQIPTEEQVSAACDDDDAAQTISVSHEDEDLSYFQEELDQTICPRPASQVRGSPEIPITPKRKGMKRKSQTETWIRNSRKEKRV